MHAVGVKQDGKRNGQRQTDRPETEDQTERNKEKNGKRQKGRVRHQRERKRRKTVEKERQGQVKTKSGELRAGHRIIKETVSIRESRLRETGAGRAMPPAEVFPKKPGSCREVWPVSALGVPKAQLSPGPCQRERLGPLRRPVQQGSAGCKKWRKSVPAVAPHPSPKVPTEFFPIQPHRPGRNRLVSLRSKGH